MARRQVNGIFLLNKPLEVSSNGILQRVRWLFQAEKAGHTGALDPLASGLLPICFGEATKFSQFLLDTDKTYEVSARFGIRTDTSDAAGEVIAQRPVTFDLATLQNMIAAMRGPQMQVPTMFSALKYQGQPLYKYARQGITIPREARPIEIFQFDLIELDGIEARFVVHCSKGTYIRTLIDDLGETLGCGAYVSALHRTQVGPFFAKDMHLSSVLEPYNQAQNFEAMDALLLPMDHALQGVPQLNITPSQYQRLVYGQTFELDADLAQQLGGNQDLAAIRIYAALDTQVPAKFVGIAQLQQGVLSVRRFLNTHLQAGL